MMSFRHLMSGKSCRPNMRSPHFSGMLAGFLPLLLCICIVFLSFDTLPLIASLSTLGIYFSHAIAIAVSFNPNHKLKKGNFDLKGFSTPVKTVACVWQLFICGIVCYYNIYSGIVLCMLLALVTIYYFVSEQKHITYESITLTEEDLIRIESMRRTVVRGETMRIKEALVAQTRLDEESSRFLEKYMECFCYYLPVYRELSFLVPEKNNEGLIEVCHMTLLSEGNVEIKDGEFLNYENHPALKEVLESGKGAYLTDLESHTGLCLPLCLNSAAPIGVVVLCGASGNPFTLDTYIESIRSYEYMDKIYNSCFKRYILDPVSFLKCDGNLESVNDSAEIFKKRACARGENCFLSIWEGQNRYFTVEEIIEYKLCAGMEYKIGNYDFFVIILPVYAAEEYRGSIISVNDISLFKELFKEVMKKSMMVREVHHRVKNNLQTVSSLLELQSRRSKSFMVEKALIESINRISSIALVHEELSKREENTVDMRECIHSIMVMILSNMVDPSKQIAGEIAGKDLFLNSSQASSVSLCVTELIQNCVKHAFAFRKNGTIVVTLNQVNCEVIISVEDDGVGISNKKAKNESLGLQIVRTITDETLKGKL